MMWSDCSWIWLRVVRLIKGRHRDVNVAGYFRGGDVGKGVSYQCLTPSQPVRERGQM